MGRQMLIYVILLTSIIGLIIRNVQNRQLEGTESNVVVYQQTQSNNVAYSGLELALRTLQKADYDYSSFSFPFSFSIGDASVEVEVYHTQNSDLRYNELKLVSTGTMGGESSEVTGLYNSGYPTPRGAMGFYGNNDIDFSTNGNSFMINGHDNVSNKPSMPGIMTQGNNSFNDILGGIQAKREDNYKGLGGHPSVSHDERMDPDEILDLLPGWIDNRDRMIGEYGVVGDESHKFNGVTWGTLSAPEITVIRDDTELRGGSSGAGLMIIQDGATLDMGSNFQFDGLVINNSDDMIFEAQGTPQLRGSVMSVPDCGTTSSDCETNIDIRGNVQMQYDSYALYKMQQGLTPTTNEFNYSMVSLYQ
jgi:hypothetical protein